MNHTDILVLGVKGSVIAFDRNTGRRLWEAELKGGLMSAAFVSVISDERHIFAHTAGEVFCLDLFTGEQRWHDGLQGFGYGYATLALPGQGSNADQLARAQRMADDQASNTASSTSSST